MFMHDKNIPPTVLTIFGATGDLSSDYLMPALLHMDEEGLLPEGFHLVCVGRRAFSSEEYLDYIVEKSSVVNELPGKSRERFLKRLTYYEGNFEDVSSFHKLTELLETKEKPRHKCFNRLYYFATSPQFFASIARILKETGLLKSCSEHERQVRILVEKPFGFNLQSARDLNQLLLKYFTEDQIYRIDHYLGKETVQNLMVVRFANSLFEPLWNSYYIDHVEISVLESEGVKKRAAYYDQTGALRDMVQNHILQMLALLAMDEPRDLSPQYIRDEKVKVLQSLIPFASPNVGTNLVKGQYKGFSRDIGADSATESFVALKAYVHNQRWLGVPFYLRTGKCLGKKLTEISIHFKEQARCLFRGCAANVLTFRIQPDESVHLQLNNKVPGFGVQLHQGDYEFGYQKTFQGQIPSAYERLLLDFMEGDQRLFIRSDEIEAAWQFVDSIANNWKDLPLYGYEPGSGGPKEADDFIKKDLREWRAM